MVQKNTQSKPKPNQTKQTQEKQTQPKKYRKVTQVEHVLIRPDTYIGSIEEDSNKVWVHDDETNKMVYKSILFVPGLYKIFDEIMVNASDHVVEDKTCTEIRVTITKDKGGTITVWNNGEDCVECVYDEDEKCYNPELIFGNLLSSSHFDDNKKITGGKNGIGAKAANIFSTYFNIHLVDGKNNIEYDQTFYDNMLRKDAPTITKLKGKNKSYCQVKFIPDWKRFKIDGLSDDVISLFHKRVWDIAAITGVKVFFNDVHLQVNSFKEYIKMFYNGDESHELIYEQFNDRWKVGVVYDPNSGYRQISYVNALSTFEGGSHVNYILDQITKKVITKIQKQNKENKDLKIKPTTVRDNLTLFISADIEDPSFNSQVKECLTTKVAKFGSTCEVTDDFIKKLCTTGIVDEVINFSKYKESRELGKTDGKKSSSISGIAKLTDARFAGTRRSKECTLILTEGDSAKPFGTAAAEVLGREYYGVFPLKGKMLNVREKSADKINKNEEIFHLKKIMGLKHGKEYNDVSQLRYGRIMILTDQDYDGSHIKGLLMNFIHCLWPSLLKIPGFIIGVRTPILKVWKKSEKKKKNAKAKTFFSITEFEQWKESVGDDIKLYEKPKYYKGLGTSTYSEAKECFIDFENRMIEYVWDDEKGLVDPNHNDDEDTNDPDEDEDEDDESENDNPDSYKSLEKINPLNATTPDDDYDPNTTTGLSKCHDAILLAFSKKRADDRKKWLMKYDRNVIVDEKTNNVTYHDFVNKDLIHFSNYDVVRSIPSVCDGLKPSLRKILYGCMLKNIYNKEIKVLQLGSSVSENTAYHHGESSLFGAIVGMAQNFVGSNNLNLLVPNGQFGDREKGGDNYADPRYIFTKLNELVPLIFNEMDSHILTYNYDDGKQIEPEVFAPIICTALLNGIKGIGTGFSTDVLQYHPIEIIRNTKRLINHQEPQPMMPWFNGFKGKVESNGAGKYSTYGVCEPLSENTILITELPIGTWTFNYKEFLESLKPDPSKKNHVPLVLDYIDESGGPDVKITVTLVEDALQKLLKEDSLYKKLKLVTKLTTSNMYLYGTNHVIRKYDTINDILKDHYSFRLELYHKRKEYFVKLKEHEMNLLKWKIQFISDVINEVIIVFENKKSRTEKQVIDQLVKLKYPQLSTSIKKDSEASYTYLTHIRVFDLTEENKKSLEDEYAKILAEYTKYKDTTIENMWLQELTALEVAYKKWVAEIKQQEEEEREQIRKERAKKVQQMAKGRGRGGKTINQLVDVEPTKIISPARSTRARLATVKNSPAQTPVKQSARGRTIGRGSGTRGRGAVRGRK